MAVQRKHATTVRLTRRTYDALQQRAQRVGRDADALADEMLEKAMHEQKLKDAQREQDRIGLILSEAGMLRDTTEYRDLIPPELDLEAVRAELRALRLDPPLSETILRERHEE